MGILDYMDTEPEKEGTQMPPIQMEDTAAAAPFNVEAVNTQFQVDPSTLAMLDRGKVQAMDVNEAKKIIQAGDFVFNKMPQAQAYDMQVKARAMADAERAQMTGDLPPPPPPSMMDKLSSWAKGVWDDEEQMTKLALAFNTMRLEPDQALAAGLMKRLGKLQDQKGYANLIPALKKAGMSDEAIAALSKNPELMKAVATKVLTKGFADTPAEYRRVTMALEKAGIKEGSPEFEKAMRILAKIEAPAGSFLSLTPESMAYRKLMEALGTERGKTQAEEEATAKKNEMLRGVWNTSLGYLEKKLMGTTTGFFAGLIPAITENQQLADQSVSMMLPLLKDMYRQAGEGVFTDKDQEILNNMIPTRSMSAGAIAEALQQIDKMVQMKLRDPTKSIEELRKESAAMIAPATSASQTGLPPVTLKSVKPVGQ